MVTDLKSLGNGQRSRKCITKVCAKMEESEHCHKTKRKNDRGDKLVQFVAVKEEKS